LFTSDIKRFLIKRLCAYGGAALGCLIFSRIYALFSHGVSSFFMTFLWLPPLVAALLFGGVILLIRRSSAWFDRLFSCGVSCVTVRFCLRGVFEIAGTDSPLLWGIFLWGGALIVASAVALLGSGRKDRRS
jgi:hypothetical protein